MNNKQPTGDTVTDEPSTATPKGGDGYLADIDQRIAESREARQTPPDARNVHQRVADVIRDMPGIGKNERMDAPGAKYDYRGIEAIKLALKPLLGRHGVHYTPVELIEVADEPITKGGKPWMRTTMRVHWMIYGADGSSFQAESRGEGEDNADKASNKAMTVAEKQMLLTVFAISDQPDPDHERVERGAPAARWSTRQVQVVLRGRIESDVTGGDVERAKEYARQAWAEYGGEDDEDYDPTDAQLLIEAAVVFATQRLLDDEAQAAAERDPS